MQCTCLVLPTCSAAKGTGRPNPQKRIWIGLLRAWFGARMRRPRALPIPDAVKGGAKPLAEIPKAVIVVSCVGAVQY